MSSSAVMEKELTCSICTDLLYDPVIFLDCLHTNCGSCAKSWFASLSNAAIAASGSSSAAAAKYTCPVCRAEVRATKHHTAFQSLLENFIAQNPDKDRTDEEKVALRKLHTPGNGVLPGEARTGPSPPPLPARRSTARPPPPPPSSQSAPQAPTRTSISSSLDELSQFFWNTLSLDAQTSCFHCQRRVDYSMFCRCLQCDITTCIQCFRLDKGCRGPSTNHVRMMQKLQLHPTRYIQSGVFCDICETWCDNSRVDGGMNSYFWVCMECNSHSWEVCMTCVSKGNCCSHELLLFTNTRPSARNALVRGYNADVMDRLGSAESSDRTVLLDTLGYVRWTNFNVTCDSCQDRIPPDHLYLHCTECRDGQWDVCMDCWNSNSDDYAPEDGYSCNAGHKMLLLTQNGREGTHKLILDAPHEPPDYVAKTPVSGHGRREAGARSAVALKSHWPDPQNGTDATRYRGETPGVRPWEMGGLLAFPEKAAISDVWVAFTEGDGNEVIEYLWGWYAGAGGLFPRDCVRFTD